MKSMAARAGFACASAEDQQRIAEFYGYRDEERGHVKGSSHRLLCQGFVATMNSLRTDLIRPRLLGPLLFVFGERRSLEVRGQHGGRGLLAAAEEVGSRDLGRGGVSRLGITHVIKCSVEALRFSIALGH